MANTLISPDFLSIIRIAYTKPPEVLQEIPQKESLPRPVPIYMSSERISSIKSISDLKNSFNEFMSRPEWKLEKKLRWNLLCCESSFMFAKNEKHASKYVNESFTICNHSSIAQVEPDACFYYLMTIYFDTGFYSIEKSDNDNQKTAESQNKNNDTKKSCVIH
jgi:hypothetical protein